MFNFTALLCVRDSVGSSNMAGCSGFGRCSFSFPLSPIPLSYFTTPDILDCPPQFYCFFISSISPLLFPFSPASLVQSLIAALKEFRETKISGGTALSPCRKTKWEGQVGRREPFPFHIYKISHILGCFE